MINENNNKMSIVCLNINGLRTRHHQLQVFMTNNHPSTLPTTQHKPSKHD
ncbi:hypothetical protein [Brumicola pallidula]|nr:hypothetical protein [Glaciecola pallidula]